MSKGRRLYVLRLLLVCLLAIGVAALLLSAGAYTVLTRTIRDCASLPYDPSHFETDDLDLSAYWMPEFRQIDFPSREAGIQLSGYLVPAEAADEQTATVILVHGVASCKRSAKVLLPAAMLHRGGFNVLVMDLRDHGASAQEDGHHAAGTDEYLDVLGAWDWLLQEEDISPDRIGLFGFSLGGASVILAAGEEAQVAAVWADSAFADVELIIDDIVAEVPYLGWMKPLALAYGRVMLGDDLLARRPVDALAQFDGRPLFIVHGDADSVVPIAHAYALTAAYPDAAYWEVSQSGHVEAMFRQTEDYEDRLVAFFATHLTDGA
jgi:pimeloyl-ACP methyl ester carboxylesterase